MKVKLLRCLRKDIRITEFKHNFYDIQMFYNFKWRRQGSYHYMRDVLKSIHFIMNYRLKNDVINKMIIFCYKIKKAD